MSSPPLTEAALLPYRGMGSGIPRALGEWPQIELISEVSGNQFTALVRRPQGQWEGLADPISGQVKAPVFLTETDKKIIAALVSEPLGRSPLLGVLGYSQPTGNYKVAMAKLLQADLIERTLPDKPNSRLQQYRLTEQGKGLLK